MDVARLELTSIISQSEVLNVYNCRNPSRQLIEKNAKCELFISRYRVEKSLGDIGIMTEFESDFSDSRITTVSSLWMM